MTKQAAAADPAAVFSIHVVGEVSNKTWTGTFEAKQKLSKLDQLRQDNFFRFYLGDSSPQFASEGAQTIAEVLSQLKVRLVQWPEWWAEQGFGEKIEDDVLLKEIYTKAMAVERGYLEKLKVEVKGAQDDLRSLGTLGDGQSLNDKA